MNRTPGYEEIPIEKFDALAKDPSLWEDGPFISTFGNGDYEPYIPFKRVFGTLKDDPKVPEDYRGLRIESVKEPKITPITFDPT